MTHKLKFYTQYHQFYLIDKDSPSDTGSDNFWSPEAYNCRLAIKDGVLGIGTGCYGNVKAELEILDNANDKFDSSKYDHIVEGGLELTSGVLQVTDCPNSKVELELNVVPGKYQVRVYSSNLDTVYIDDENGDDYYRIEIWPDDNMERKVLKVYNQS